MPTSRSVCKIVYSGKHKATSAKNSQNPLVLGEFISGMPILNNFIGQITDDVKNEADEEIQISDHDVGGQFSPDDLDVDEINARPSKGVSQSCQLSPSKPASLLFPASNGTKPRTEIITKNKVIKSTILEAKTNDITISSKNKTKTKAKSGTNDITHVLCRSRSGKPTSKTGLPSPMDGKIMMDGAYSHIKTNSKHLAWLLINLRGWVSKKGVFNNLMCSSDIDVFGATETHTSSNKMTVKGFKLFNRSRANTVGVKGGIAIGVRDNLAEHTVKVFEGEDSNECIMVKITCFNPPVIFGTCYGNQEGTTSPDVIRNNIKENMLALDRFKEQGFKIIWGGDLNLHVGLAIEGNDPKVSKGGEFFIDQVNENDFHLLNNMAKVKSHTHFDVSSNTSRVLDIVISNTPEDVKEVVIDIDKDLTPYRLLYKKGVAERRYTDHLAIYGELKVNNVKRDRKPKVKIFNIRAEGAKAEFQRNTNERAKEARRKIVQASDCTAALEEVNKLLFEIKTKTFKVRTVTQMKLKRMSDEDLALRRCKELQEVADEMGNMRKKIPEKVFIGRNQVIREEEEMLDAIDHYKTGQRLEDPESIFNSVMDYNVEVLTKNDCADEWSEQKKKEKEDAVAFFEQVETEDSEDDFDWEDWVQVMQKITLINKTCYRDLVWAGHEWQAAMFLLFQRIYREEDIPQAFLKTKLKKLYKRKGDRTKLSSYRFIHLKEWAGKVMEKLAMQKCNDLIAKAMPVGQIGGMKKSCTSEHIATIHALARMKAKEGSGLIVMFVDVKKCFDKQRLKDTMSSAATAGVTGKRLRIIRGLHDNTEISLIGDPSERSEIIVNSTGQGTNWAPLACSLSMGQTLKSASDAINEGKDKMVIGDIILDPLQFVDDSIIVSEDTKQARTAGQVFTRALNELGLEAHADKSAMVVIGAKKYRDKIKKELKENPVFVQGWELKTSECETYLGVEISEKGPRDSVNRSIKKRARAAFGKEVQLSKVLGSDWMDKVGWIEAVKTLTNSIISPTLTYAKQSYAFMTKTQVNEIERVFKEILYRLLRISKYSHYASVLLECNMIRIKHIMNQLKIGFIKDLIHSKQYGPCLEILKLEESLYPGSGLIGEVGQLCAKYKIPDVITEDVDKDLIRKKIWEFGREEIWDESVRNNRVPFNRTHVRFHKQYMSLDKYSSRLFFAYRIGEIQMKDYRKAEFTKRFGDTKCFIKGCNEPDRLDHVRRCQGYPPDLRFERDNQDYDPQEQAEFIEYLTRLDSFRAKNFDLPLLFRPSLRKQIERSLGITS